MTEFRDLGRILTTTEEDWLTVIRNFRKAKQSSGRMVAVLGREGADPKVSRTFYIAVTQAVLLFGSETWVLARKIEKDLDSFQSRVLRKLTGRQTRRRKGGTDGTWYYPFLAGSMKEAGIVRIRTSILRRQNTVAQFIAMRTILGLCEKSTRRPGARVARRWWEQTGIDWKGAQEREETATAAAVEPGTNTFTDLESETDEAMYGTVGGTGEEVSLGASGSS